MLFTAGSYSDYGVNGLYRAKRDFVVPGRPDVYGEVAPDIYAMSADVALVDEVQFVELWRSE